MSADAPRAAGAPEEGLRVAFLTNFVSPYRRPVLERLGRTPGWQLRVFVNADMEFDRSWETEYGDLDVVCSKTWTRKRTIRHTYPIAYDEVVSLHMPYGLATDLARYRPHLIISSELGPRSLIASAYAAWSGCRLAIWSYHSRASVHHGRLQRHLRQALLRRADAAIGMGTQARDVLRDLEVPDHKIFDAWNSTDHETLLSRSRAPEAPRRIRELRETIGANHKVALVVGRLIPLKGVPELLEAWHGIDPAVRDEWRLVFLGDGPYRPLVEAAASEGVIAAGPVPAEEIADWFGMANLHVFASLGDVWGLVVNEALSLGVPTLCSVHAGCCEDLIVEGVSGLTFDPVRVEEATRRLEDTLQRKDLPSLGEAGRRRIAHVDLDAMAESFRIAARYALGLAEERPVKGRSAA